MTPEQIAGESFVRERLRTVLETQPDLATICDALNRLDQETPANRPVSIDLLDRPLPDVRRIVSLGQQSVNQLDPEIVQDAVENVARVLCAEGDAMALFEVQDPRVQSHFLRLAQSCVNAVQNTLERLS